MLMYTDLLHAFYVTLFWQSIIVVDFSCGLNKGVPPEKRQKVRSLKPIAEFSHDGDQYKVTGSAEGFPERTKLFILDVEQEETTMDGRKVKVLFIESRSPIRIV